MKQHSAVKTDEIKVPSSGRQRLTDNDQLLRQMISSNRFGSFFGVSQQVLDAVWQALSAPDGNSVTYISMEIGADLDVFNPVTAKLKEFGISEHSDPLVNDFIQKFLHGPVKIPNYGGGLGILAGDTLKSMADCKVPVVAVSLLYRKGYFSQALDSKIGQISWASSWEPEKTPGLYRLQNPDKPDLPLCIEVPFFDGTGNRVMARAEVWMKMEINEGLDFFVPEILLDYQTEQSPEWIQNASHHLYDSSSESVKAIQRRLLGAGIVPVMKALGISSRTIHLNEQHGVAVLLSLVNLELEKRHGEGYEHRVSDRDILDAAQSAAERFVFTIHTPVMAGHDRFPINIYQSLVSPFCVRVLDVLTADQGNASEYNFTALAMRFNRTANSVSRLHQEVTKEQFPQFADKITAITNGVHHLTWISDARAELYDSFTELNGWRRDPGVFAGAALFAGNKKFQTYFEQAWQADTERLVAHVNRMLVIHRAQRLSTWIDPPNYLSYLDEEESTLSAKHFTLGFARRFSTYKRADLIFEDIDRLAAILVHNTWPVNFIYAGKAHPADQPGKNLIKNVLDVQEELYRKTNGLAKLVFIPNYDMDIAKMMVAGVHAWLNCPKRPLEASGTSGMKAAMNGVPNISIMDGWWVEGYSEGKTGWKFGYEDKISPEHLSEQPSSLLYEEDSASFYEIFPEILKQFYNPALHEQFLAKGIANLSINCPIFNTHRMAAEYVSRYRLDLPASVQRNTERFRALYCSDSSFSS